MPKMKQDLIDKITQLSNNKLSIINNKYYYVPNGSKGHCSKCGIDIPFPETISTKIVCSKCGSTKVNFGNEPITLEMKEDYKVEINKPVIEDKTPITIKGEVYDPKKLKDLKDDIKRFNNDDIMKMDTDKLTEMLSHASKMDDETLKTAYEFYRQSEYHTDKYEEGKGIPESIYAVGKEMDKRKMVTLKQHDSKVITIKQPNEKVRKSIEPTIEEKKEIENEILKRLDASPEKELETKAKDLQYKVSQVDDKLKEGEKKNKMTPRIKALWISHVDTFGRLIGNIEIKLITKIKRYMEKKKKEDMITAIKKKHGVKYDENKHLPENVKPWKCPNEVSTDLIEAWSLLIDTYLDMGLDEFLEKLPYLLLIIAHINLMLSMMDD